MADPISDQIRDGRIRMLQRLQSLNNDAFDRLIEAYGRTIPVIDAELTRLMALLNAQYPYGDGIEEIQRRDAAMRRFRESVIAELTTVSRVILDEAGRVQRNGAIAGIEAGIDNLRAGGIGIRFNTVPVDTILAGINYVDDPAFRLMVAEYAGWHADKVSDVILSAIATGQNPRVTAQAIKLYFQGRGAASSSALEDALRWARTTQNYAARRGTLAIYADNGVSEWVWSANIGSPRTCLACIAMHGTVHPVTETLNDHHNGRCAAIPITPSWRELGFADGREPTWETGVDWFLNQSEIDQMQMMGPELYQAYIAGMFPFNPSFIVGTYEHPVFGTMRRRRSNVEILTISNQLAF